jgi:hypothetical protein
MAGNWLFWCECARRARKGTGAFANDWQWVFGVPAVSAIGVYVASVKGATDLSTGYPALDAFLAALAAFLPTWAVAFSIRMYKAAPALFLEQKSRADILEARLAPRLRLAYGSGLSRMIRGRKHTFVVAINGSDNDASGVQVKVAESRFKKIDSELWEKTNLIARTNLSWCYLADGHPQKYSTIQLQHGSEPLDFITGPEVIIFRDDRHLLGFRFRMDPSHGTDSSVFFDPGTYKFVLQISGLDSGEPQELTLFVGWDGKEFVIRSENPDAILETSRS